MGRQWRCCRLLTIMPLSAPLHPAAAGWRTGSARTAPSFRLNSLEQRQREEKARCEQGDPEQQAGQEQAERVHDERPSGLELTEHQRWVRTGCRRYPLRGIVQWARTIARQARSMPVSHWSACAKKPRAFAITIVSVAAEAPHRGSNLAARCGRSGPSVRTDAGLVPASSLPRQGKAPKACVRYPGVCWRLSAEARRLLFSPQRRTPLWSSPAVARNLP